MFVTCIDNQTVPKKIVIYMQKDGPYTASVREAMLRINEAGLPNKYHADTLDAARRTQDSEQGGAEGDGTTVLSLKELQGAFYILGGAVLFSFIVFAIEVKFSSLAIKSVTSYPHKKHYGSGQIISYVR